MKSTSPPRPSGMPSDLEARIAQLDARLRQARQENEAVRSRLSPSPRVPRSAAEVQSPYSTTSTTAGNLRASNVVLPSSTSGRTASPRNPQPSSPSTSTYQPRQLSPAQEDRRISPPSAKDTSPSRNTPRGVVHSPWRAVQRTTTEAQDREVTVAAARHSSMANAMQGQIHGLQDELSVTNQKLMQKELELSGAHRSKDVAVAESTRAVETAEHRVAELEKARSINNSTINDLQSQRHSLQRQLEETKLGIASAEARSSELEKEQMALEGRIKEITAALRERERAISDENDQSAMLRRRLESRLAALEEEHQQAAERLRRLEAQQISQEQKWRAEEQALQKQNDDSAALLTEMKARQQILEEEIEDREAEAVRQREARERKAEDLVAQRLAERERDMESSKREIAAQEIELEKEREEALHELRQQLEGIRRQTDSKRRAREAQEELSKELEAKLSSLKGELEQKSLLLERCQAAEERVSGFERRHEDQRQECTRLAEQLRIKDTEIADLQAVAHRLNVKAEEERRLRAHVAELAHEVTDTQATMESERALDEQRDRERQHEIERLNLELTSVRNELAKVKDNASLELDTLGRRCAALRADISDKEALLSNAVNEHAAKQAAIAEFEEEKRRIERDQLARKAAAAQAAKAALTELSY